MVMIVCVFASTLVLSSNIRVEEVTSLETPLLWRVRPTSRIELSSTSFARPSTLHLPLQPPMTSDLTHTVLSLPDGTLSLSVTKKGCECCV